MQTQAIAVFTLTVLSGCSALGPTDHNSHVPPPMRVSSGYQPLIDNPGPKLRYDLADCNRYAEAEGRAGQAIVGAAAGALVGVAIDAISGGGHLGGYSGLGAAAGGVGGYANAAQNQKQIVINCMRGRGYNVLR